MNEDNINRNSWAYIEADNRVLVGEFSSPLMNTRSPIIFRAPDSAMVMSFETRCAVFTPKAWDSHPEFTRTVEDICTTLRLWGHGTVADRIAYFASDDDLDDDDLPVTLESARGFLRFFGAVRSEGKLGLTCSQEGWICAEWIFPDERRVSLWFLDDETVMYAATDSKGSFVEVEGDSDRGKLPVVMEKLVEAGLFTWPSEKMNSASSHRMIMWHANAGLEILTSSGYPAQTPFFSEITSPTYRQTGSSSFTRLIDSSRYWESSGR